MNCENNGIRIPKESPLTDGSTVPFMKESDSEGFHNCYLTTPGEDLLCRFNFQNL